MMGRISFDNLRSRSALACFLLTVVIGVSLDLWTKKLAWDKLCPKGVTKTETGEHIAGPHEAYTVIPNVLSFRFTVNEGAVFGIGQGMRWLFLAVSVAAIGFIGYLFLTSGNHRFYQFILGLLLAGVLGNMYDRIKWGYVRDMINIFPTPIGGKVWFPWIFNLADTFLCVGVGLIFLYSLKAPRPVKDEGKPAEAAAA